MQNQKAFEGPDLGRVLYRKLAGIPELSWIEEGNFGNIDHCIMAIESDGDNTSLPAAGGTDEAERRRELRVPLRVLRVHTDQAGDVFFGYANNVSLSGVFVQTPNPKKPGLQVDLRFKLPRKTKEIQCKAEVMWAQEYAGKGQTAPGMGLRFVEISVEDLEEIRKFVSESV